MAVALVTGGNRGIGREVCRQLAARGDAVYLGARQPAAGAQAVEQLRASGAPGAQLIIPVALDVTDTTTIDAVIGRIKSDHGRLDVLVNNAAIFYDVGHDVTHPDLDAVQQGLDTNLFGAWRTLVAAGDLLHASEHPRVVNVSSGVGSLNEMGSGTPAYALSKVGLNALTRMFADAWGDDGVLVNSVCPGWVATDMGGSGGRPVAEGAAGVVWAATLADDGPTGGFFRDGQPIPW